MASELILGFAERCTVEVLRGYLDSALADLAAGVQVTSVTLEGGGGTGTPIRMEPERMVSVLRRAIAARQDIDAGGTGVAEAGETPMGHHFNFATRRARS